MLAYLVDESVHDDLPLGVRRRQPDIDLLRVQDAGLAAADDPTVLAWAAAAGRVVLTSDVSTLVGYAYERVRAGHVMPGVFVVRPQTS